MFLSRLAMRYYNLTNAALISDYDSSEFEFFNISFSESQRLRAFVHSVNTRFSDKIRIEGATIEVMLKPNICDDDVDIGDL
jgi:hypothetical protein